MNPFHWSPTSRLTFSVSVLPETEGDTFTLSILGPVMEVSLLPYGRHSPLRILYNCVHTPPPTFSPGLYMALWMDRLTTLYPFRSMVPTICSPLLDALCESTKLPIPLASTAYVPPVVYCVDDIVWVEASIVMPVPAGRGTYFVPLLINIVPDAGRLDSPVPPMDTGTDCRVPTWSSLFDTSILDGSGRSAAPILGTDMTDPSTMSVLMEKIDLLPPYDISYMSTDSVLDADINRASPLDGDNKIYGDFESGSNLILGLSRVSSP